MAWPLMCNIIAFVVALAIMKGALGISTYEALAFTVVIVALPFVGGLIRHGLELKAKGSKKQRMQMQTDINTLKKSVAEMQEQIAELYIQQHDLGLSKKIDEPLIDSVKQNRQL